MTLAYLISAHADAPQLLRLVKALSDGQAHFFVHIDAKADIAPFQEALRAVPHVHFTPRVEVRWATFLQVEYQLILLRAALDYPAAFHRLVMLSGLDYPLLPPARIRQWLQEQGEREQLTAFCLESPGATAAQRLLYGVPRPLFRRLPAPVAQKLSILCRRAMHLAGFRRPLSLEVDGKRWPMYKGSSWFCISQALAEALLHCYDQHPEIRRAFEHTFGPDETMLCTIALNLPQWAPRCTLVGGAYPGLAALTPLHFIIYEPVIQVMRLEHLPQLRASGKLFARKFVSGASDALVAALQGENAG